MTAADQSHWLQEAFRFRGCPVCHRLDGDEIDFMCRFQGSTLQGEEVRRQLVSSRGYCNFHFHEMARLTSPAVNSVVTRDLVHREILDLERGFVSSGEGRQCPVCRLVTEREEFYLREFTLLLKEDRIQGEYESSDGLCRVHLEKVILLPGGGALFPLLLATQGRHLQRLKAELDAYLMQDTPRRKVRGREKNAWMIAVQKLVGKRGLQ